MKGAAKGKAAPKKGVAKGTIKQKKGAAKRRMKLKKGGAKGKGPRKPKGGAEVEQDKDGKEVAKEEPKAQQCMCVCRHVAVKVNLTHTRETLLIRGLAR